MGLIGQDFGNGRKGKRKKERKKRMLFSIPRMVTFLSPGKRKKSPEPQCFQGIRRKKEREKEEERDGFRDKIFKRDSGEKGWKKGREKEGKNALFQSFRGAFLSPEEGRNPVVSREGEREKR